MKTATLANDRCNELKKKQKNKNLSGATYRVPVTVGKKPPQKTPLYETNEGKHF